MISYLLISIAWLRTFDIFRPNCWPRAHFFFFFFLQLDSAVPDLINLTQGIDNWIRRNLYLVYCAVFRALREKKSDFSYFTDLMECGV